MKVMQLALPDKHHERREALFFYTPEMIHAVSDETFSA